MAYVQKLKPCKNCKTDEGLAIFKYESGCQHVECVRCNYLGPGSGSVAGAAKLHNEKVIQEDKP